MSAKESDKYESEKISNFSQSNYVIQESNQINIYIYEKEIYLERLHHSESRALLVLIRLGESLAVCTQAFAATSSSHLAWADEAASYCRIEGVGFPGKCNGVRQRRLDCFTHFGCQG